MQKFLFLVISITIVMSIKVMLFSANATKEAMQTNFVATQLEDSNADIVYKKLNQL